MTVAPAAIMQLNQALASRGDRPSSYTFDGIVGDAAHSFGYHLSPNQLRANGLPDDYSLTLPRDAAGAGLFPDDASAWDLGFGPDEMRLVTGRLVAAAKNRDPRLVGAVREFAGTTNGTTVHPYDVASNFDDVNNTERWDDSHLWHVHISFYRDVCNDYEAMAGVVDVICGHMPAPEPTPSTTTEDDLMFMIQNDKSRGGNGGIALVMANGAKVIHDVADVANYKKAGIPGPVPLAPAEFNSYPKVGT